MILMAVAVLTTLAVTAQKVYGDKPGWTVYTAVDEYTDKKSYYLRYYNERRELAASYFPGTSKMAVLEWYDGVLFFDVTLEAVTERRGQIPDDEIKYEWRVTMPEIEPVEVSGTAKMTYGDVEMAGDTFFGTFVFEMDTDWMKWGTTVAVKWYDPMRGKIVVRKIPLTGFTRCYNECLRRYGVKER